MTLAISAVVALGCHSDRRVVPTSNRVAVAPDGEAHDLAAQADRLLAGSVTADYEEPFAGKNLDRDPIRVAYDVACRRGDHRACWMVNAVSDHCCSFDDAANLRTLVNCGGGDQLSCRAGHGVTSAGVPGACWGDLCNDQSLRRDCEHGYPVACYTLAGRHHDDAARNRALRELQHGCDLGIISECAAVLDSSTLSSDETFRIKRWACLLDIGWCNPVRDPDGTVGLLERRCQRDTFDTRDARCGVLARAYLSGSLPEPVAGRGRALQAWICRGDDEPGCQRGPQ